MDAQIRYIETGTKNIEIAIGTLFFGDALLQDYVGVKTALQDYILIPNASVIDISVKNLDEELFMVDTDTMKKSKEHMLTRMNNDYDREQTSGGAFQ